MLEQGKICWNKAKYAGTRQNMLEQGKICWNKALTFGVGSIQLSFRIYMYGMGHKKVPVFYKTTTVQRKFCVPFPCPFRSTYYRVYFCCVGKIILSTWNGEQTVKKTVKRTL